jgi:hypothetical protein
MRWVFEEIDGTYKSFCARINFCLSQVNIKGQRILAVGMYPCSKLEYISTIIYFSWYLNLMDSTACSDSQSIGTTIMSEKLPLL